MCFKNYNQKDLLSKEAFMVCIFGFFFTIMSARRHNFSKLKSNGYIYHQFLNPVALNHGAMTHPFILKCTSNNLLPSIAKFVFIFSVLFCFS